MLLEFAQEIAPLDDGPDVFDRAVDLAVLLWNSPLLPESAHAGNLDQIRQWLANKGLLDLQVEIMRLLELRQTRYPTDRRMVMDYQLTYEPQGPRFTATSVDLTPPEKRLS